MPEVLSIDDAGDSHYRASKIASLPDYQPHFQDEDDNRAPVATATYQHDDVPDFSYLGNQVWDDDREPRSKLPFAIGAIAIVAVVAAFFGVRMLTGSFQEDSPAEVASEQTTKKITTTSAHPVPDAVFVPLTDERVVSAQAAMSAWGQFASSLELGLLNNSFDPDGPQYNLLEGEAASNQPVGGNPYSYEIISAQKTSESQDRLVLRVVVAISRDNRAPTNYYWDITQSRRPDGNGWWVYTVTESPTGTYIEGD